jgi:hypothetical protein
MDTRPNRWASWGSVLLLVQSAQITTRRNAFHFNLRWMEWETMAVCLLLSVVVSEEKRHNFVEKERFCLWV